MHIVLRLTLVCCCTHALRMVQGCLMRWFDEVLYTGQHLEKGRA